MDFKYRKKGKYNNYTIKVGIVIVLIGIASFIVYTINVDYVIGAKEEVKETMSAANQDDYVLQRINEKYRNSNIESYFPVTKYEILNKEIKNIVDARIKRFKDNVKDDIKYSMFINFDMYKCDNYIGFVFHVFEDFAGAHPNTYIVTVNYNIKSSSISNIDTLIKKNNSILSLMSKYSYTSLSNEDKIKEINMLSMLKNGTKPTKDNFDNFVFTKDGLTVFFEKYQIAPYAAGEFSLTIPYEELNLKLND